jgi:hypothetical protein
MSKKKVDEMGPDFTNLGKKPKSFWTKFIKIGYSVKLQKVQLKNLNIIV